MGFDPAAHTVEVVHNVDPDEWYVVVDGRRVLTFSGPSAWTMAISHQAELNQLLADDAESRFPGGQDASHVE
jgi:hypothetical protein